QPYLSVESSDLRGLGPGPRDRRRLDGNPVPLTGRTLTVGGDSDVFSDLRGSSEAGKVRSLSRACEKIKTDPRRDRRFHRQRTLREHAPAGLDPVALNLARREIRGAVAHGWEASRHPAARPG